MGTTTNRLTPAEAESLALLTEEMGESLHAIGKILRHGRQAVDRSVEPHVSYDNDADLQLELGQVIGAILVYQQVHNVPVGAIEAATNAWLRRIGRRLNHIDAEAVLAWMKRQS